MTDIQHSSEPEPCDQPFPSQEEIKAGGNVITHAHEDGRVCLAEVGHDKWQTAQPVRPIAAPTVFEEPEPEEPRVDQKQAGLYNKYNVSRVDGRDKEGGDRFGAQYFVLDVVFDPAARIAATIYAVVARQMGYEALADDMERAMENFYSQVGEAVSAANMSPNPEDHIDANLIHMALMVTPPAERYDGADIFVAARNTQKAWARMLSSVASIDLIDPDAVTFRVVPHA